MSEAATRTWVKLCGCTDRRDVEMVIDAGADAFGMIFAPSPRRIAWDAAVEIAAHVPESIRPVGVFVDPSEADVAAVDALFPQAWLQFSGSEAPSFVQKFGSRAIKTVHVDATIDTAALETMCADFPYALILFDTRHTSAAGGTGTTFAWERVTRVAAQRPVVIAGGLAPENVAACIRATHPFGVDVRSGVERDGRKDPAKMQAFVRAVRGADAA